MKGTSGDWHLYVPRTLSEIYDLLGSMILWAPTFSKGEGSLVQHTVETEFTALTAGFGVVRKKLGEERYAEVMALAAEARQLFADDQDDTNGKTDQGRELLYRIEDVIQDARKRRVEAKAKDEEGRVSGD